MAGLELPEMALFRRPTYGTPSSERARPNGGGASILELGGGLNMTLVSSLTLL